MDAIDALAWMDKMEAESRALDPEIWAEADRMAAEDACEPESCQICGLDHTDSDTLDTEGW